MTKAPYANPARVLVVKNDPSEGKLATSLAGHLPETEIEAALEAAGFRQEAILRDQLRTADGTMDVILLERR